MSTPHYAPTITVLDNGRSFALYTLQGFSDLSNGYAFEVEFIQEVGIRLVDLEDLLDTQVAIEIKEEKSGEVKKIYGYIQSIEDSEYIAAMKKASLMSKPLQIYKARVVSALSYLRYTFHSRIYHEKNSLDIISEILAHYSEVFNFSFDHDIDQNRLVSKTYTTQYQESDYDFIMRLAHEDGYVLHANYTQEMMTLTATEFQNRPFQTLSMDYLGGESFVASKVHDAAYDKNSPSQILEQLRGSVRVDLPESQRSQQLRESLHFQRHFQEDVNEASMQKMKSRAEFFSQYKLCQTHQIKTTSSSLSIHAGLGLHIEPKDKDQKSIDLLVLHCEYQGYFPEVLSEYDFLTQDGAAHFSVTLDALPATIIYRPDPEVNRPKIDGILLGRVVKVRPEDDDVSIDTKGRVKVDLFFGQNSPVSCFLDHVEMFAGNGYGSRFIPRVNSEVMVSFLAGNPDEPVITGTIHNGNNLAPYNSEQEKTKSYIKTQTTPPYKDKEGYNEILFEDKEDEEKFSLKAQKEFALHALEEQSVHVGHNLTQEIGQDESVTINKDETLTVANQFSVKSNAQTTSIGHKQILTQKNFERHVYNESLDIKGSDSTTIVEGNALLSIEEHLLRYVHGDAREKYLQDLLVTVGEELGIEIKGAFDLQAKGIKYEADTINIDASDGLSFTAGGSTVQIDSSGIHLNGAAIDTTAATAVTIAASGLKPLEMPELNSLRVTAIEVDVALQSELEEVITFTATVEKYEAEAWNPVSELQEHELLQLNWNFFKADTEDAVEGFSDDEISYDGLTMIVKTGKENKHRFGFGHCVVGNEEVEAVMCELKREAKVVRVMADDLVSEDSELSFKVVLDVKEPTPDEISTFSAKLTLYKDLDENGEAVEPLEQEVALDDTLEVPYSFKKSDNITSIVVTVHNSNDEANTEEGVTGVLLQEEEPTAS